MGFRVIVSSVELFTRQGTGIRTFSRSLVAALVGHDVESLDLLLSTTSQTSSGMLAGSNILQKHLKIARLSKILSLIRVKKRQYFKMPFVAPSLRLLKAPPTHPLHHALLEVCFGQAASEYQSQAVSELHQKSAKQRGFLCAKNIFVDAKTSFKATRKLLELKLPIAAGSYPDKTTVFHSPLPYPIIIRNCINITTIHDLIPLSHPDLCLDDPAYFYDLIDCLLERFDAIHCISHYAADKLKTFYGSKGAEKVFVAHQPIPLAHLDHAYQSQSIKRLKSRYDNAAAGVKYILQVGSIEPKKNHQTTLDAFRRLREYDPSLRLVLIGKPGWLTEDLCDYLASAKADGIDWLRSASYGTMIKYLQGASAVVFPSTVEGWGLPPLEAMSYGAPVITSPIPPCKEACGSAALYMNDPLDSGSLAKNLTDLLTDYNRAEDRVLAGFEQAKKYSSMQFAANLVGGYKNILSRLNR
jgi:glycosyltransferase involved in cell wall biosynthesis